MKAGSLRHRVTIQQRADTQSSMGGMTEAWSTYAADVPAEIVPLSGREFVAAGAQRGEIIARIMVRYDSGLTEQMRVVFEGKTYPIHAILSDSTFRRHMSLMVSEGLTDA